MSNKPIFIQKASGERVPFQREKLYRSLERAGAIGETIDRIISSLEGDLYEGITTKKIYQAAFALLKKKSRPAAAKYKLKQAIMELGPSGFPFERYIGEILRFQGYQVKIGEIVKGHCVMHEIDVVAEKNKEHLMIECKFHNLPGIKSNVKVPLYINSRFQDVAKQWNKLPGHGIKFHQGWVVTNTKFTEDAIRYGSCAGLYLLGWDYPEKDSLKQRIDASGLHPLTCLTTLSSKEKKALLEQGVVLCKELCQKRELLKLIGLGPSRIKGVVAEATELCREEKI